MAKKVRLHATQGNISEVINEAIENGNLPHGTRLGGHSQTPQGHFPRPDNAVGEIHVGYKTGYWLIIVG